MSIERCPVGRNYELTCDVCGMSADDTFDEFMDAVNAKKQLDWRSIKTGGGGQDVCPDCIEGGRRP